ncbi:hypothetical protein MC7420_4609 [Coleofasciculus chthonoplastes PCC 7420]|uniref:Uncharacterized protein n=1 Tax=Coleofasciculus chthonoplastes PCC 7420 TaxID=118168 RepID=B4VP31_9CYAN|nr:hypothetical protein [Coleofasciculus chthonoplastes]EDX76353.1 hypothetical protein MC7420_4609 [Coleofasciculus chthonoplastes PCC 7420]
MTYLPAETIVQQALAELGITQLLSLIKRYSDIDFDASQMHLTDAEAQAIAKLLIQQLTESLNGKLIAGTLNTLRHSEEMEEFTEQSGRVLPPSWVKQFLFVSKPAPTHSNLKDSPYEDDHNPYRYPTHSEHEREPLSVHSPTGRYNPQKPHNPRPITQREKYIIDLYCYCELGMTPRQFYAKWDVTYEQLSHICSRSLGMVQCWFNRGQGYRPPQPVDLRHLAILDFLLEHFEELPPSLLDLLCSS